MSFQVFSKSGPKVDASFFLAVPSKPAVAEEEAEAKIADVASAPDGQEFDKSLSSLIYIPTLKNKLIGTAEGSLKVTRASFSEPQFDELAVKDPLVLTK